MDNTYIRNPLLEGDEFFWKGNQTGILLIHGFTATTAEVRLIAELLQKDGFTTSAPLLPGHGTHPDDLNRATWQMWLEEVKNSYEKLVRQCEKTFIIGESMGALLALELAAQHPEVEGLILVSPAIKVNNLWMSRLLAPFKAYQSKSAGEDGLAWKGYNVYPLRASVELLKLQKHTLKQLIKINQPALVITGDLDKSIKGNAPDLILDGIQSRIKHHRRISESAHCVLLDKELDQAHQYVLDFIHDPTMTS